MHDDTTPFRWLFHGSRVIESVEFRRLTVFTHSRRTISLDIKHRILILLGWRMHDARFSHLRYFSVVQNSYSSLHQYILNCRQET